MASTKRTRYDEPYVCDYPWSKICVPYSHPSVNKKTLKHFATKEACQEIAKNYQPNDR